MSKIAIETDRVDFIEIFQRIAPDDQAAGMTLGTSHRLSCALFDGAPAPFEEGSRDADIQKNQRFAGYFFSTAEFFRRVEHDPVTQMKISAACLIGAEDVKNYASEMSQMAKQAGVFFLNAACEEEPFDMEGAIGAAKAPTLGRFAGFLAPRLAQG